MSADAVRKLQKHRTAFSPPLCRRRSPRGRPGRRHRQRHRRPRRIRRHPRHPEQPHRLRQQLLGAEPGLRQLHPRRKPRARPHRQPRRQRQRPGPLHRLQGRRRHRQLRRRRLQPVRLRSPARAPMTGAPTPTPAPASPPRRRRVDPRPQLQPRLRPRDQRRRRRSNYFINVIDLTLPNDPPQRQPRRLPRLQAVGTTPATAVTQTYIRDDEPHRHRRRHARLQQHQHRRRHRHRARAPPPASRASSSSSKTSSSATPPGRPAHAAVHHQRRRAFLSNQFLPGLGGGLGNLGGPGDGGGTPLFDARGFSDRFYLALFVPTRTAAGDWAGTRGPAASRRTAPEHAARSAAAAPDDQHRNRYARATSSSPAPPRTRSPAPRS